MRTAGGSAADALSRLIGLCARAECTPAHDQKIVHLASEVHDWQSLPVLAHAQGVAPLVYAHLRRIGFALPPNVEQTLYGIYLYQRRKNEVMLAVLERAIGALDAAGAPALALKGSALACLVYPEPALRPMADLDILIRPEDVPHALTALRDAGFSVPPQVEEIRHRHLPPATFDVAGCQVPLEIHFQLLSDYFDHARVHIAHYLRRALPLLTYILPEMDWLTRSTRGIGIKELIAPPQQFRLGSRTAYTLGHPDMLWHLCEHFVSHVNVWEIGRLLWAADIVSYAEKFAAEIDWAWLRRHRRGVLEILTLLHHLTPLSEILLEYAQLHTGRTPQAVGVAYRGWPTNPTRLDRLWQSLADTLNPPEWWLRLRYRVGPRRPLYWQRLVRHPLHIAGHLVRRTMEQLGWPTPLGLAGIHAGSVPKLDPGPRGRQLALTSRPRRKPGYVLETLGDKWVLVHAGMQHLIHLNWSAALIWETCDGTRSIAEIIALLVTFLSEENTCVDCTALAADVVTTVEELTRLGTIENG